ncbi:MAG: hypothetical protein V8S87_03975 [Oscillospiraceae bacterium]
MTEQERAELERLKAALRQVNENSGYGSDATFTTRLVFRTAVLRYWHADRDGAVYRLFETFAELDGDAELTRLRCSSTGEQRQAMDALAAKLAQALPDFPPRTRGSCAMPACAPSRGGTVSPRNMVPRTGRRRIR